MPNLCETCKYRSTHNVVHDKHIRSYSCMYRGITVTDISVITNCIEWDPVEVEVGVEKSLNKKKERLHDRYILRQ